jgi:uncharacterized membrane protein
MSQRRLLMIASLAGLSALVVTMIGVRIVYTGNDYHTNLVWNLFLAWIPFVVAIWVYDGYRRGAGNVPLWAAGALWLVFFPNATYIVTDIKWLRYSAGAPLWYDVVLVAAAAWCGLLLGFASLYMMQAVVRSALGTARAWVFVLAALALSSFGVYLGRFERWNSWDVFTRPRLLVQEVLPSLAHPQDHPKAVAVTVLFTAFLAMTYLVFYVFAHTSVIEAPERVPRRR